MEYGVIDQLPGIAVNSSHRISYQRLAAPRVAEYDPRQVSLKAGVLDRICQPANESIDEYLVTIKEMIEQFIEVAYIALNRVASPSLPEV
jgi:hypothetical protein